MGRLILALLRNNILRFLSLIRSLAKALGGSTTSLTSGIAGGGGGGSGGGGSRSSDEVARSRLTKGYFKELLSAHFRQPDLKVDIQKM